MIFVNVNAVSELISPPIRVFILELSIGTLANLVALVTGAQNPAKDSCMIGRNIPLISSRVARSSQRNVQIENNQVFLFLLSIQ